MIIIYYESLIQVRPLNKLSKKTMETKIVLLNKDGFGVKPGKWLLIYEKDVIETLIEKLKENELYFYHFTTKNYESFEHFNRGHYKEQLQFLNENEYDLTSFCVYASYFKGSCSYSFNHILFCYSFNESLSIKKIIKHRRNGRKKEIVKEEIQELKGIKIISLRETFNLISDICRLSENEKKNLFFLISQIEVAKYRLDEFYEKEFDAFNFSLQKQNTLLFKLKDFFPVMCMLAEHYNELTAECITKYIKKMYEKGFYLLPSFETICVARQP